MTDGPLTHFHFIAFLRLLADLYNREREELEAELHSRCVRLSVFWFMLLLWRLCLVLIYVIVTQPKEMINC